LGFLLTLLDKNFLKLLKFAKNNDIMYLTKMAFLSAPDALTFENPYFVRVFWFRQVKESKINGK
jgi:hypothetical protein